LFVYFFLIKLASEYGIYPHDEMLRVATLAYTAALQGLHVLLEGPSGCGLTTLTEFLAYALMKETKLTNSKSSIIHPQPVHHDFKTSTSPPPNYEQESSSPILRKSHRYSNPSVLLGPESTVENLIGVFKPTLGKSKFVEILIF
jgi:energy-coupling factor transporter ATP-binding protein EcfA2